MKYNRYGFIKEWKKINREILQAQFPDATKKEIDQHLDELIEKHITLVDCEIHNNHVHKSIKTNLLAVMDWIEDTKPICGGHGVFYKNQNQVANPLAVMISKFLTLRKKFKKMLWTVKDVNSFEYKDLDRKQLTEKIMANSIYGCLGNWASFIFNLFTAPSVTGTGQSLISTTCCAFEAFLVSDSIKFHSLEECLTFIRHIKKEKRHVDSSFLPDIPPEVVAERLVILCINPGEKAFDIIYKYLCNIRQDIVNRIYYKNNLYKFSDLRPVRALLTQIVNSTESFKDPNEPPEKVIPLLDELWEYYEEFVFYNGFYFNRIDRLKKDYRKATVTIDTDSNMVNVNPWKEFLYDRIVQYDDGLQKRDQNELRFVTINVMAYIITKMVSKILVTYTKKANIPKEHRHYINMKNEFLFSRIMLADKKKKYITSVRLREGNEIFPEKVDIKGYEFMKSSATEDTKRFYIRMINRRFLETEDISVADVLRDLDDLEKIINDSLLAGKRDYLTPANAKEIGAYKDGMAMRILGFRSTMIWNIMYPDMAIQLPSKVDVAKLDLSEKNLKLFEEKYPEEYKRFFNKIMNSKIPEIAKKYQNIAIPRGLDTIPPWIIEFIDKDTITYDVLKKFYPVLHSLNLELYNINSTTQYYSNVISI